MKLMIPETEIFMQKQTFQEYQQMKLMIPETASDLGRPRCKFGDYVSRTQRRREGPALKQFHRLLRAVCRVGLQHGDQLGSQHRWYRLQIRQFLPSFEHLLNRITHVKRLAKGGCCQHQSQAVDVGSRTDSTTEQAKLFRSSVAQLAYERTPDDGYPAGVIQFGDTKIDQFGGVDVTSREYHIIR
jgi:hypothetical protein